MEVHATASVRTSKAIVSPTPCVTERERQKQEVLVLKKQAGKIIETKEKEGGKKIKETEKQK